MTLHLGQDVLPRSDQVIWVSLRDQGNTGLPGKKVILCYPETAMSFGEKRRLMVKNQLVARGIADERVLKAMGWVPREIFVPKHLKSLAYEDFPLEIGEGQTISQPYVVALTGELLKLKSRKKVLDIGAGSGYQAAVLGQLAREVFTVEVIKSLAEMAEKNLKKAGIKNVRVILGDGKPGLPAEAPFEGIACAAATQRVPQAWKEQLAMGGRLVLPIKSGFGQDLVRFTKLKSGFKKELFGGVTFVPLV